MSPSPLFRVGLGFLAVSAALDLLLPLVTDGSNPPMAVALAAAVLGLASLVLVISVWRGAGRALPWLLVLRLPTLSALLGLSNSDAPAAPKVSGAMALATAVIGAGIVLLCRRTEPARSAYR